MNELKPAHEHKWELTIVIIICVVGCLLIMIPGVWGLENLLWVLLLFLATGLYISALTYRYRRWMRCPSCGKRLAVKPASEHKGKTLFFPCNDCKIDYDSGLISEAPLINSKKNPRYL